MARKKGSPVKKRSKASNGTRRSVRISSKVSSRNNDNSQDGSMNYLNERFFVEDDFF